MRRVVWSSVLLNHESHGRRESFNSISHPPGQTRMNGTFISEVRPQREGHQLLSVDDDFCCDFIGNVGFYCPGAEKEEEE